MRTCVLAVIVAAVMGAGPATRPAASQPFVGPFTVHASENVYYAEKYHQQDPRDVQHIRRQSQEIDRDLADYFAKHETAAKVREAAESGRPAPGMPEELLIIIGRYELKYETEMGKRVRFFEYGLSLDSYDVSIERGKVVSVAKADSRPDGLRILFRGNKLGEPLK